jgi:hypothetical protein
MVDDIMLILKTLFIYICCKMNEDQISTMLIYFAQAATYIQRPASTQRFPYFVIRCGENNIDLSANTVVTTNHVGHLLFELIFLFRYHK